MAAWLYTYISFLNAPPLLFTAVAYAMRKPDVTIDFVNYAGLEKQPFPVLQLCSLPRKKLTPIRCEFEDKASPGGLHAGTKLTEPGSVCEFEPMFRVGGMPDGDILCLKIDSGYNASSASRFSRCVPYSPQPSL